MFRLRAILGVGIAVFLFFPSSVAAHAGKFSEKMEKTEKLLKEEQAQHEKEKNQSSAAMKSLTDRIKTLEGKIEEVEKESKTIQKQITVAGESKKLVSAKKLNTDFFLSRQMVELSGFSQSLKKLLNPISRDYDEKTGRLDNFEKLTKNTDSDLSELCRELCHYWRKEIDGGYTLELYSDEVETEKGEIRKAKFVRVGDIIFAYRTNDGEESGLWIAGGWKKNQERRFRSNIKKAIEIMEGKRIPQLLEFPVELNREEK